MDNEVSYKNRKSAIIFPMIDKSMKKYYSSYDERVNNNKLFITKLSHQDKEVDMKAEEIFKAIENKKIDHEKFKRYNLAVFAFLGDVKYDSGRAVDSVKIYLFDIDTLKVSVFEYLIEDGCVLQKYFVPPRDVCTDRARLDYLNNVYTLILLNFATGFMQ